MVGFARTIQLGAALAAFACTPAAPSGGEGAAGVPQHPETGHVQTHAPQTQAPMVVELELPAKVRPGQPVPITLRAKNTGNQPVELALPGRPVAYDIIVTTPDGTVVWRRLHDAVITSILQLRLLQPGEVLEFTEQWAQVDNGGTLVPPGTYLVRGVLPTEGRELVTEQRELVISR